MNTYYIIDSSDLELVDFTKTLDDIETIRLNVEETRALVRWVERCNCCDRKFPKPSFMNKIKDAEGPYNQVEMRQIILGDEWNEPVVEEDIYAPDYEPLTFEDAMNKSEEE